MAPTRSRHMIDQIREKASKPTKQHKPIVTRKMRIHGQLVDVKVYAPLNACVDNTITSMQRSGVYVCSNDGTFVSTSSGARQGH